jgi:hypothetical protein
MRIVRTSLCVTWQQNVPGWLPAAPRREADVKAGWRIPERSRLPHIWNDHAPRVVPVRTRWKPALTPSVVHPCCSRGHEEIVPW